MNVYDEVNSLTKTIRQTREFTVMKEARVKLKADATADSMVQDFLKKKQELEFAQISGKTPDKEEMDKVQKLYEILALNPTASEYIQAYIRFQMMVNDISKSLGDVIKEAVEG